LPVKDIGLSKHPIQSYTTGPRDACQDRAFLRRLSLTADGLALAPVYVIDQARQVQTPFVAAEIEAFELQRHSRVPEVQAGSAALVRADIEGDGRTYPVR
jgi:hypothetical protein